MNPLVSRWLWRLGSFAVGVFFIWLWQKVADARLVSPVFLPGPDRAWSALVRGFNSGILQPKLLGTIQRMIYGWFLASLLGIALGTMIGISPVARRIFGPTLEFLRPLPSSAVIPLAIALFGLSEGMVLGVIGFGALWPMLLSTVHGFAAVEPRLYEVSRALGMSRLSVILKIALPSSMPDILAGMRLGLTISLILAVVGEMLTGRDGLGNWILLAARSFRAPDLYAGVILLGLLGYVSAQLLAFAESRLLRWRAVAR
jgi:sulfonate transport system permease protein